MENDYVYNLAVIKDIKRRKKFNREKIISLSTHV